MARSPLPGWLCKAHADALWSLWAAGHHAQTVELIAVLHPPSHPPHPMIARTLQDWGDRSGLPWARVVHIAHNHPPYREALEWMLRCPRIEFRAVAQRLIWATGGAAGYPSPGDAALAYLHQVAERGLDYGLGGPWSPRRRRAAVLPLLCGYADPSRWLAGPYRLEG